MPLDPSDDAEDDEVTDDLWEQRPYASRWAPEVEIEARIREDFDVARFKREYLGEWPTREDHDDR